MSIRDRGVHGSVNRLTFGIGKPRLLIKVDQTTQTNDINETYSGLYFHTQLITKVLCITFYVFNTVYMIVR